jgi:hypothetical protein
MFDQATAHEPAQDPLDHRPQGPVLPGEARGPDSQQLLQVLLHQTEERGLARPSRLVDHRAWLEVEAARAAHVANQSLLAGVPAGRAGPCGGRPLVLDDASEVQDDPDREARKALPPL